MPKYEFILFDADATLLDFKRSEYEAVRDVLSFYSLPFDDEVIEKYSEINDKYWRMLERGEIEKKFLYAARWRELCETYSFDCDAEEMSKIYIDFISTKSYLICGAEDICKKLYGKVKLYIITNGNKKVQNGRFNTSPLYKYFEKCFISEDIGYEKPRIEFFDKVASDIEGFSRDKAIVIGDSLTSDIAGGINAGIDTCWFNPKSKNAPDGVSITYTVSDLSQIEDIVL